MQGKFVWTVYGAVTSLCLRFPQRRTVSSRRQLTPASFCRARIGTRWIITAIRHASRTGYGSSVTCITSTRPAPSSAVREMTSLGTTDVIRQATRNASQAGEASTARLVSQRSPKQLLMNIFELTNIVSPSCFHLVIENHFTDRDVAQTESTYVLGSEYFLRINNKFFHSH